MKERIEILPVSLLDQNPHMVKSLRKLARRLGIELGWHYLLDLIWVLKHVGQVRNARIIDAGAGVGIIQWYLAGEGAEVISVDRECRAGLPLHFRLHYNVEGLRESDLKPFSEYLFHATDQEIRRLRIVIGTARNLFRAGLPIVAPGRVLICNQDLQNLRDIGDGSVDVVVSISSLEHNQREQMECVVSELVRTLKPGGKILATLNAARDQDWYHEPSQGWCLCEDSLRSIFNFSVEVFSNYSQFDELFSDLCQCAELSENLAKFYTHSGNNGMPWGVWDPKYIPVGVLKVKDQW
jgi:SAM-dependent methyltransferase